MSNVSVNRMSLGWILRVAIGTMAAMVIGVLGVRVTSSWTELTQQNRIAGATSASSFMFTALYNLRTDRTQTVRHIDANASATPLDPGIKVMREAENSALEDALREIRSLEFSENDIVASRLQDQLVRLKKLQAQTDEAARLPKSNRPAGLAKDYDKATTELMDTLDEASARLLRLIKLEDAFVDQLFQIKQVAWSVRNMAGDTSVFVSNGLTGVALPPDAPVVYSALNAKTEQAWSLLQFMVASLPQPDKLTAAMVKTQNELFSKEFSDFKQSLLDQQVAGIKPQVTIQEWTAKSVPRLNSVVGVAQAALEMARQHTTSRRVAALWSLWVQVGMLIAAGVITLTIALITQSRIIRPLNHIGEAMHKLASGDLEVVLPFDNQKDEIGEMARAVGVLRRAAVEKRELERTAVEEQAKSETARRIAEEEAIKKERALVTDLFGAGMACLASKDLTFRLSDDLPQAYVKLKDDFNNAMEQLETTMEQVAGCTGVIARGTQEVSASADQLSSRTEKQAANLEETAAALEEITTTGQKAAEGTHHAREVVVAAQQDAEKSSDVVRRAVDAMSSIEQSAQQISQIISFIYEIAFQTNLLALNAGVEAARAGDAGRGFAVVASEVRALAQRSADAAREIKKLITTSTSQVSQGVELVAETGQSLQRILDKVSDINKVVLDIAAGAQQQATGLTQVNSALTEMDRATQQNAAMVEETTAASHSLASETDELTKLVAEFRLTKAVDHHVGRRLPSRIASKELKTPNRAGQFRAARLRKAAG